MVTNAKMENGKREMGYSAQISVLTGVGYNVSTYPFRETETSIRGAA